MWLFTALQPQFFLYLEPVWGFPSPIFYSIWFSILALCSSCLLAFPSTVYITEMLASQSTACCTFPLLHTLPCSQLVSRPLSPTPSSFFFCCQLHSYIYLWISLYGFCTNWIWTNQFKKAKPITGRNFLEVPLWWLNCENQLQWKEWGGAAHEKWQSSWLYSKRRRKRSCLGMSQATVFFLSSTASSDWQQLPEAQRSFLPNTHEYLQSFS